MQELEKVIGELADQQNIAIMGSIDANGFPNIKAMLSPRKREGIRVFWLTTNTSSMRVAQFLADPKACVYFFDRRKYRGAMLLGSMEVLEDEATKEMIWQPGDIRYYHKGVSDPDYCVLKFTAVSGRYYADFLTRDFTLS